MDIVVANGFAMERCTFFSREYHCCVLHNTRCKCEDYNPRNSKPITNADKLRAKSDKELAEWMVTFPMSHEDVCPKATPENCIGSNGYDLAACKKCWLGWLKQEVSEWTALSIPGFFIG